MKFIFVAAFVCCALPVFAQGVTGRDSTEGQTLAVSRDRPIHAHLFPLTDYPRNYFRDPLAIPMSLAANFGELRPNHYHMGLDIRTQHRENLPVFAAADGYVARVSVEPAGFGQAIYINHPNGYTTVYGHLNRFFPALAAYIRDQQYRRQSWQVNLELPPTLFPVKKGDVIAYSGNTGGSQGPHLHFEIRRTAGDVNCNPLLFGLPVPDNTPPTLLRLAWYDRNEGIYEQSPHILPIRREAKASAVSVHAASWSPIPSLLTVPTTRISFALSAFDTQSGSANPNGIYEADLFIDDDPVIGFRMNNISYDNTRNINAHIDYKTRETGGPYLQQLFVLPGYPAPSIYGWPAGHRRDGVLQLDDGRIHNIRVEIRDTYGNTSLLRFQVRYVPPVVNREIVPSPGKKFYVGMVDGLETSEGAFYLGEKSLYDSVTLDVTTVGYPGAGLSLPGGVSPVEAIGAPWIPLLDPVLVRLRPTASAPPSTDNIVMVCFNGAQKDVERPQWQGGWASARFREFGKYQLVADTLAPVITTPGIVDGADLSRASRIAISIHDNLGALRNFRAELDGAWLCFSNDKGLAYIYTFDDHCPPGRHTLHISVEDVAGNKAEKEIHFIR